MFRKILLLTTALTIFHGGYSFAQDANQEKKSTETEAVEAKDVAPSSEVQAAEEQNTKERQVLLDRVVHVTSKLDKDQATHFFVMYSNYSIISLVNNVEKDVNEAVTKCGNENPTMKGKVDSRFEGWKTTISKARDEAQKNIDNMVMSQEYMSQDEAKEVFSLLDKTRIEADSRFQRIPVSTPEACEFMLTKMDETQKTMDQLLRSTVASYPNLLKKNQK